MNNDGRMDQLEFSIAMKLIKLKLQGYQLPSALPPIMKQPPIAISTTPGFGKNILYSIIFLKYFVDFMLSTYCHSI